VQINAANKAKSIAVIGEELRAKRKARGASADSADYADRKVSHKKHKGSHFSLEPFVPFCGLMLSLTHA